MSFHESNSLAIWPEHAGGLQHGDWCLHERVQGAAGLANDVGNPSINPRCWATFALINSHMQATAEIIAQFMKIENGHYEGTCIGSSIPLEGCRRSDGRRMAQSIDLLSSN